MIDYKSIINKSPLTCAPANLNPDLTQIGPVIHKPAIVDKRWGYEMWIHNSEKYCGKFLVYNTKERSSLHFHLEKTETFFVMEGEFNLMTRNPSTAKEENTILSVGMCVHLNPGTTHQLTNLTDYSILVEVSTQHFDHDSIRIQL